MTKRIIYQKEGGGVVVLIPAQEYVDLYGVDAIAQKDVPFGRPYKIVDTDTIPTDAIFRDAWEVDAADLTDGVGAESSEFQ